ncbi:iron-sulfur cluster assembly scaffold protein [Candidatus Dependentiae bacterium]|nr:iron-sulfur cluster assembly scaffold protein [Candidatus Dependentiae bacterium]
MADQFYQKVLMDHFKNPRNKVKIENYNFESGLDNPACGDIISMTGIIEDGVVKKIGFEGSGCVVSLASASMLTEKCLGMSIDSVLALTKDDVVAMLGMELGPNRLQCALLSLEALHKGILAYRK